MTRSHTTMALKCAMAIALSCLSLQAKVLLQDDMDGAPLNPLRADMTDTNATYTVVHDCVSPFAPTFDARGSTGYLNDQSTAIRPRVTSVFASSADSWTRIEYDLHLTSGSWWQWVFSVCGIGPKEERSILTMIRPTAQGFTALARVAAADPASKSGGIGVPNVVCREGDWYHVELLFSPPSGPPAEHQFSVTIKDQRGVTGTASNLFFAYDGPWPISLVTVAGNDAVYTETGAIHLAHVKASEANKLNLAYYPYHDTIKAALNIDGLQATGTVQGVKLTLRARDGGKVIATTKMPPFKANSTELEWKIPKLGQGRYEVMAEFEGITAKPMVEDFVRNVMPWEHNSLGKSDVIVEPFTPIQVHGQSLSTILRTNTLNKLGLFDQVESQGRPLLQAPMRLNVKVGGPSTPLRAGKLRFVKKTPTRVVTESKWNAGPVAGTARGEWDYDGLMKWTLEIRPSKETIETMTLVIPLDDKLMPLFHACTDGLRFNYAGLTPAGQGRVWDGSKAPHNAIVGSYVPYIWIGAEERGLAVFGENDRGWVTAPDVPCQELVRNGNTLELRLNLIAAPAKIEQPRRIVIGFQATPTKPMPEGWRTWQAACGEGAGKGIEADWTPPGACYYWGGLTMAADLYPRNGDFSLYEKFAETRKTGKIDQEFLKHWLEGYPPSTRIATNNEWGCTFEQLYVPHINAGFGIMAATAGKATARIIPYTNARGALFDTAEGQTFVDEWQRDAFNPHVRATYYDVNPVESFRDYALWCYQKMLDTWADDIKWDNTFLTACFDTVGTDAYELPNGIIQPSVGLFNMRELIRRTAVFNHERNKRGLNQAHMTNTEIVPILSFCEQQQGWEDRAGDADFQDRFSREYIRAESLGRHAGNAPFSCVLINGATDDPKNQWVLRTYAGVALTHEIRPQCSASAYLAYWNGFLRLLDFGYGKKAARVWNYWDADYPVHIVGSETSSLVVSKPGSAIVVVCDYGNGGNLSLTLDASLGLGEKLTAKDMESGQTLTTAGNTLQFALKKHDFKMVLIDGMQSTTPGKGAQ